MGAIFTTIIHYYFSGAIIIDDMMYIVLVVHSTFDTSEASTRVRCGLLIVVRLNHGQVEVANREYNNNEAAWQSGVNP